MGVVEVSSVNWHDAGGDFVETYLDMSGPYGAMYPYAQLLNLCLVVEPDATLGEEIRNYAVHKAALTVADQLGEAVRALTPPEREVFELTPVDPALPQASSTSGACTRRRRCRARPPRSARRPTG